MNSQTENAQLVAELRAELLDNGRALAEAVDFVEHALRCDRPVGETERLFDNVAELRECNRQMVKLIMSLTTRVFTPVVIQGGKSHLP